MMKKKGNIPRYDLVVPLSYLVLRKIYEVFNSLLLLCIVYMVSVMMYVVYLVYGMVLLVGIVFCFFFFFLLGRFVGGRERERSTQVGGLFSSFSCFIDKDGSCN